MRATFSMFDKKCLRRSNEYVVAMETCSCHGNDVIRMCIKFHLHARMLEECRSNVKEMCLRLLVVFINMWSSWKHGFIMEMM